jgi:hypothetical protein
MAALRGSAATIAFAIAVVLCVLPAAVSQNCQCTCPADLTWWVQRSPKRPLALSASIWSELVALPFAPVGVAPAGGPSVVGLLRPCLCEAKRSRLTGASRCARSPAACTACSSQSTSCNCNTNCGPSPACDPGYVRPCLFQSTIAAHSLVRAQLHHPGHGSHLHQP